MRVDLGEMSTCAQCGKRFQTLTAFARWDNVENFEQKSEVKKSLSRRPDGRLLHYSCAQLL